MDSKAGGPATTEGRPVAKVVPVVGGVEEEKRNEAPAGGKGSAPGSRSRTLNSRTTKGDGKKAMNSADVEKVVENLQHLEHELLQSEEQTAGDSRSISAICADNDIILPPERDYKGKPGNGEKQLALFIYTDLEPDDVFAILCQLQDSEKRLVGDPVTVFTTEPGPDEKDERPVYQKKLMLTASALGAVFADSMKVVSRAAEPEKGKEKREPFPVPWPYRSDKEAKELLMEAAKDFIELAEKYPDADLMFLAMAPGRSNLGELLNCFEERGKKESIFARTQVELYSGQFNMKGMTTEDIRFFEEATRYSGRALVDVNHFLYTGGPKGENKIANLAQFCPSTGRDLFGRNPFLATAWQKYAVEFDKKLLDPFKGGEKLFGKRLKEEGEEIKKLEELRAKSPGDVDTLEFEAKKEQFQAEEKELKEMQDLFASDDFWGYVRSAHKSSVIRHINPPFKKRVITALATFGFHEGPLCDVLCYLNRWLLKTKPEAVENGNEGTWWVDLENGRSGVGDPSLSGDKYQEEEVEGKMIWTRFDFRKKKRVPAGDKFMVTEAKAIQPKLKDPHNLDVIESMSEELHKKIMNGASLVFDQEIQDILDDSTWRDYGPNAAKLYLVERMKGYDSLNNHVGSNVLACEGCECHTDKQANIFASLELKYQKTQRRVSLLNSSGRADGSEMNELLELMQFQQEEHKEHDEYSILRTKKERRLFHKNTWKKRWLPQIMTRLGHFDMKFIIEAGKRFTKSLEKNPIYLTTLRPDAGGGSNIWQDQGEVKGDEDDRAPQFLAVSSNTRHLIIGTKERVVKLNIENNSEEVLYKADIPKDDKKRNIREKPKDPDPKGGIKAMAYFSHSHEDDIASYMMLDEDQSQEGNRKKEENPDSMLAMVFEDRLEIHSFEDTSKVPTKTVLKYDTSWLNEGIATGQGTCFPAYTTAKFSSKDDEGDIYLVLGGKQGDQDIYGGRADIFSVDVLKEKAREIDMLESKTQKSNSVLRRSPSSMDLRRQPSKRGSYLTGEEEDYIQTRTPSLSQFEIKRINGLITCLDLSPNADRLLVGGKDRHAAVYVLPRVTDGELWKSKWRNKAKGTPYYEVEADATIDDVAFSGDSCRFAVAHSKRVDVHDAAKGSFLFMVETDRQIYHIECSRDGRQLAIGTRWDRRALQIWDMHSGQHKLFEHQMRKGCRHLAFSPCGTFIAVANKSQVERVCPQTGSVKLQKVVHEQEGVSSVAASPCGNYFSYGRAKKVDVFTTQYGEKVGQHIPIDDLPRALVFYEHKYSSGNRSGQTWLYLVVADVNNKRKSSSVRIFEVCQIKSAEKGSKDKDAIEIRELENKKIESEHGTQVCLATTDGESDNRLIIGSNHSDPDSGRVVLYRWEDILRDEDNGGAGAAVLSTSLSKLSPTELELLPSLCMCCDITLGTNDHDPKIPVMVIYGGLEPGTQKRGIVQRTVRLLKENKEKDGKFEEQFPLPVSESVRACKFSPGGQTTVIAGDSRRILVFSCHLGELLHTININDKVTCLAFSHSGNFLAVGGNNKSVTIIDTEIDASDEEKMPAELFRLTRGGIVWGVAFSCPKLIEDRESALVVGSADRTCTVFEQVLKSGPPIGVLHEEALSVDRALKYNPLLPVITRYEFSMLDRCLRDVFKNTGAEKMEAYNTVEVIMKAPMGPMAIHPRHYLMAMNERDERLLGLLLTGAAQGQSPQRLRYDTVMMLPMLIRNNLSAAISNLFRNMDFENTGCELHAIKEEWSTTAYVLSGGYPDTVAEKLGCVKDCNGGMWDVDYTKNERLSCRGFLKWAQKKIIGGRSEVPLTSDMLKSNQEFDHFLPWSRNVDDEKGILVTCQRVPLPSLASRMVLSHLLEVPNGPLRNHLFSSDCLNAVIQSNWTDYFYVRHVLYTLIFSFELLLWVGFCLCIKYNNFQQQHKDNENFSGKNHEYFYVSTWLFTYPILATCLVLLYHEWLQQNGLMERTGNMFQTEKLYWSNVFDISSQAFVGLAAATVEFDFISFYNIDNPTKKQRDSFLVILAWGSLLMMLKFFVYLGGYSEFAWLIVVLQQNVKEMIPFFAICLIVIVFFTGAFEMLTANAYMTDYDQVDCEFDDDTMCDHFEDDTIADFQALPYKSLLRVFTMGIVGESSQAGFDKTSNEASMILVYFILMVALQIVALNALIAILQDSYNRVTQVKKASLNVMLSKLMVEYMDCWEGTITRRNLKKGSNMVLKKRDKLPKWLQWWLRFTNGSLLELELRGLWTHKLKVSDEHVEAKNMMDEILENQKVTNKKISHIMNRDFVVAKRDREKLDQQLNDLKKNVANLTARLEERDKVQRGSSHASIIA